MNIVPITSASMLPNTVPMYYGAGALPATLFDPASFHGPDALKQQQGKSNLAQAQPMPMPTGSQQQQPQQQYIMVPASASMQPQQQQQQMVFVMAPQQNPQIPQQQQQQAPKAQQQQQQPLYYVVADGAMYATTTPPTGEFRPMARPVQQPLGHQMVPPTIHHPQSLQQTAIHTMVPQQLSQQALLQSQTITPFGQPHTTFYIPQTNTFVNGGRVQMDKSGARPVVKKPKSDTPINSNSPCRHFIHGRCNRRKCRFLHIDPSETHSVADSTLSFPNTSTTSTALEEPATQNPLIDYLVEDDEDYDSVGRDEPSQGVSFTASKISTTHDAKGSSSEEDDGRGYNPGVTLVRSESWRSNDVIGGSNASNTSSARRTLSFGAFSEAANPLPVGKRYPSGSQ